MGKVTQADVYAGNGVVHVIDAVMLPPGFVPPTPPSPQTCTEMDGLDCDDGENIAEKPAKSQDECCAMCVSTKGCKAWTWNKKVASDRHQTCYTKKDCKKQTKKDGVVSGKVDTLLEVVV